MISNLFDTSISLTRVIENVRTKSMIFGEGLRIRVNKFKQNLPENYSKNFRGSMPSNHLRAFPVSQSALNFLCLKHVEIMAFSPFKISR